MDTLLVTNLQSKRLCLCALSILAVLAIALPAPGIALAQETPNFRANPTGDWVDAWFWPLGAQLHLTIEDPNTAQSPDFEMFQTVTVVTEPPDYATTMFGFAGQYDLKLGDELTLTDGVTTKTHVVAPLSVTSVDMAADTVAGISEPGATVHVFSGPDASVFLTADDGGLWYAAFGGLLDIVPGTSGGAQVWDEDGDSTIVDWSAPPPPPDPSLTAFPEDDAVEGWEWPDGSVVHLAIDDPATVAFPDFEREGTMAVTTWGDPRTYVRFDFADVYDLKAGDSVTITDGVTDRNHTVRNLSVTGVNAAADTVAGTADPGESIQAWPHGIDEMATVQTTAAADGTWLADFSSLFDIVAGTGGRSQTSDPAGNSTAINWNAPSPSFTAFPEQEVIEGWGWPLDAPMHLAIDDPATGISPDFERDGTVILTPWEPAQPWVWLEFPDAYDLKTGDVVTLTDGVTPQTHVVQNLSVTAIDPIANTVTGTADPGKNVTLWSWEDPAQTRLQVTADAAGAWAADFDDMGFDLVPDDHVVAEVWDEAGNDTAVNATVSAPPPPPSPITQGLHVRLPADAGWMDSGLVVAAGVSIDITASGQAITAPLKLDRDARSGPDGESFDCADSCALDGAPFGALIGRIGQYGEPFLVGSSYVLNPTVAGSLYLAVNDKQDSYSDNRGNFIVLFGN